MPFIEWNKEFSINNQKIDLQHMELVNIYNKLVEYNKKGLGEANIKEIIKELADYSTYHFECEERLFAQNKIPDLELQKEEHLLFKKKLIFFIKECKKDHSRINIDLMNYLYNWITTHVLHVDAKAKKYFDENYEDFDKDSIKPFFYKDIKVNIRVSGRGPSLLLIPDNTHSSVYYKELERYLVDSFSVITLDLPGTGKSGKNNSNQSQYWQNNSILIKQLIEHLDLHKCFIFACGGSGYLALNTASQLSHDTIPKIMIHNSWNPTLKKDDIKNIIRNREKIKKTADSYLYSRMHGDNWEEVINDDNRMLNQLEDGIKKLLKCDPAYIKNEILFSFQLQEKNENRTDFLDFVYKLKKARILYLNEENTDTILTSPLKFSVYIKNFFIGKNYF